jgi:hypothetical protein
MDNDRSVREPIGAAGLIGNIVGSYPAGMQVRDSSAIGPVRGKSILRFTVHGL